MQKLHGFIKLSKGVEKSLFLFFLFFFSASFFCNFFYQVVLKNNYGFCEFLNYSDAKDAVRDLNGTRLLGVRVTVEMARGEVFRQDGAPVDTRSVCLLKDDDG